MLKALTAQMRLGGVSSSDELGYTFHQAALSGNKRALKKCLTRGIRVDYPNSEGQSPLYLACIAGKADAVDILLKYGASPNERSDDGTTPIHAACYSSSILVLSKLIEAGGDLRLHDNRNLGPRDWAEKAKKSKKQQQMLEFIERMRLHAMTSSGRDLVMEKQPSHYLGQGRLGSITQMLRPRASKSVSAGRSVQSMGFGKIYLDVSEHSGTVATIPLVPEAALTHDEYGLTYNNGAFMVMESMMWRRTGITVKRLHKQPPKGGMVDHLIAEHDHMVKISHPNVLLLMGICQTENLDSIVLLYERVGLGSVFHLLHERMEKLPLDNTMRCLIQVCDALIYLHDQRLLHCFITSHAVQLITHHLAKIGNLEYMIEKDCGQKSQVINNKYVNAAYNWMAPEVMDQYLFTEEGDVYSFASVIVEMLSGNLPWNGHTPGSIRVEVVERRKSLEVNEGLLTSPLGSMIASSLSLDYTQRNSIEEIRKVLLKVVNMDSFGGPGKQSTPLENQPVYTRRKVISPQSPRNITTTTDDSSDEESSISHNRSVTPTPQTEKRSPDQYANSTSSHETAGSGRQSSTPNKSQNNNCVPILPHPPQSPIARIGSWRASDASPASGSSRRATPMDDFEFIDDVRKRTMARGQTIKSPPANTGMACERPFSYLDLSPFESSTGVKPAGHSSGRRDTSHDSSVRSDGSVSSLYQMVSKRSAQNLWDEDQKYNTLPRHFKPTPSPDISAELSRFKSDDQLKEHDSSRSSARAFYQMQKEYQHQHPQSRTAQENEWVFEQGSIRDLISGFQQQSLEHQRSQEVLRHPRLSVRSSHSLYKEQLGNQEVLQDSSDSGSYQDNQEYEERPTERQVSTAQLVLKGAYDLNNSNRNSKVQRHNSYLQCKAVFEGNKESEQARASSRNKTCYHKIYYDDSTKQNEQQPEEFYFDDVFHPDIDQEQHMKLQTSFHDSKNMDPQLSPLPIVPGQRQYASDWARRNQGSYGSETSDSGTETEL